MEVIERDEAGHVFRIKVKDFETHQLVLDNAKANNRSSSTSFLSFIAKVFLPAGYPRSVSPDYLRYQILNALQAFCSSLAGLLSSRATLEGYGVGDASATATNALLLTVLQDIFGRLTTIVGAFFFGSSLFPEAKTYRFLADLLNDAAIIIDTLSPLLASLYDAASLRSLCGIAAGGSKNAIKMHFATPLEGTGDVGDLDAKDSSKETVLALLGMLIGTLTVPYLTTPSSTYAVLFAMVFLHLLINYLAVRGVIFRTLNRQRTCLAWMAFKFERGLMATPTHLASLERLFTHSDNIRSYPSGIVTGRCTMGSTFSACFPSPEVIDMFRHKHYILCLDRTSSLHKPHFHILLKSNYNSADQLQAWVLACEASRLLASSTDLTMANDTGITALMRTALASVDEAYSVFLEDMHRYGWITATVTPDNVATKEDDEYRSPALLPGAQTIAFAAGPPKSVILGFGQESKKEQ
ncbi:DUF647-domain-containing protein [Gymnopus androsaceus JB14]|uniref:DUF647-domain-containing protein n=1 Tax=Gymnopus androsaceus JB14 TaxID=1447944 RepID=A0A6A4HN74_9AGAR|nr:DUF647-domain-containing protein [Gymnopus androsaceus JB14]